MKQSDFQIGTVQTSIFNAEPSAFASGRAVKIMLREFGERFDGEMQALPLAVDALPQIPHAVLNSENMEWRLKMGPARIDAIWTRIMDSPPDQLSKVAADLAKMVGHYVRAENISVNRVAFIVERFCRTTNPANELIKRFCNKESQQEPFNRSSTFEIHNHKVYSPRKPGIEFEINSWVRCKTAILEIDKSPIVAVVQDLNSRSEDAEKNRFQFDQFTAFVDTAVTEANDIFSKYFPG